MVCQAAQRYTMTIKYKYNQSALRRFLMEKTTPILSVQHIEKYYGNNGNITKAVDDISFNVNKGEYIGIMLSLIHI